jgi:hypothetical protein
MCNRYEIKNYTATDKYYWFKFDKLKTDKNIVEGANNYIADDSNRETKVTGAIM